MIKTSTCISCEIHVLGKNDPDYFNIKNIKTIQQSLVSHLRSNFLQCSSEQGCYNICLFQIGRFQEISDIFKVPDIRYCIADSTLAGMVKYFHTNML